MFSKKNRKFAKLVIVVNVDWFFLSHRLPIALAALEAGHDVHIITTVTEHRAHLESCGFKVHHVAMDRSSANPVRLVKLFFEFLSLFRIIRPDVAHLVTIKPILIGGLAARFASVKGLVYAVSGLGHVFVTNSPLGVIRRFFVGWWYRLILGAPNMRIIFQNPNDRIAIESVAHLAAEKVVMIPGSGVDLAEYAYTLPPRDDVVVTLIARLLTTKGIREFVAAAEQLRLSGAQARFILVGSPDEGNPASIQRAELDMWRQQDHVELLGNRSDIAMLMAKSHIIVLPSYYGEGLPKVLIEAAACGRAVITTDMPGCRDAIEPNVTGVLIPPRDAAALSDAIGTLVNNLPLCMKMGRAGRERAERLFDVRSVVETHLKIYQDLIDAA
jgi:glycosyltransferase involved in cell wall biosynthesis